MANYENGANTRQAIVQACKYLFYEKGFHETSYSDICKAAHVNRGTIYYHFKDKEMMRYEVQWAYTIANKQIADRYCGRPEYSYILAMCIIWFQLKQDEKLRRYFLSGCLDYPVLTGKKDFSYYYTILYEGMWSPFHAKKKIPELSFASVYGYIVSMMIMYCTNPEKYDPMEMFAHGVQSSVSIWGIPQETMDQIWNDVTHYMARIPPKYLESIAWIFEEDGH